MRHNDSLDSLRAIAALGVIGLHFRNMLPCGWVGVQFFFVLSGYLITGILVNERSRTTRIGDFLKAFLVRRSLRLIPVYALYLILLALAFLAVGRPSSFLRAAPYLFTYSYNLVASNVGIRDASYVHLWSLAVEWQFYLVWPLVIWWVEADWLALLLVALVVLAPAGRALHYFLDAASQARPRDMIAAQIYFNAWSHLDAFALGGLLTYRRFVSLVSRRSVAASVFLLATVLGLTVLVVEELHGDGVARSLGYPIYMSSCFEYVWGYSIINIASAVLIALVVRREGLLAPLLANRRLRYMGTISYGLYVYHSPISALVEGRLDPDAALFGPASIAGLLTVTSVSVLAAHLSFRYYESFFLRIKERNRTADIARNSTSA